MHLAGARRVLTRVIGTGYCYTRLHPQVRNLNLRIEAACHSLLSTMISRLLLRLLYLVGRARIAQQPSPHVQLTLLPQLRLFIVDLATSLRKVTQPKRREVILLDGMLLHQ